MGIFDFFKSQLKNNAIESDPILIPEDRIFEPSSSVSAKTLNDPFGFFRCDHCADTFRYNGALPIPFELPCPQCNKIAANSAIEYQDAIENQIKTDPTFLESVYNNTKEYHPILCKYLEQLVCLKQYEHAITIGWNIYNRVKPSEEHYSGPVEWISASELYLAKKYKKEGDNAGFEKHMDEYYRINKKYLNNDILGKKEAILRNLNSPNFNNNDGYSYFEYSEEIIKDKSIASSTKEELEKLLKVLLKANSYKLSPNTHGKIHRRIGEIYSAFGDNEKELFHYQKAIELFPNVGLKTRIQKLTGVNSK